MPGVAGQQRLLGDQPVNLAALRKLESIADRKRHERTAAGIYSANKAMREAEPRLARRAEAFGERMVRTGRAHHRRDWARAPHRSAQKFKVTPKRTSRTPDSKLLTSALCYESLAPADNLSLLHLADHHGDDHERANSGRNSIRRDHRLGPRGAVEFSVLLESC